MSCWICTVMRLYNELFAILIKYNVMPLVSEKCTERSDQLALLTVIQIGLFVMII